jgi:DNA-binding HxlR family transcriptional regulator
MAQSWQSRLDQARRLLDQDLAAQAVISGGQILEDLFRWLYGELVPCLSPSEHRKVADALDGFGKSVGELNLGQLVGFFRKAELLDLAGRKLGRDFSFLRSAGDWIELRNRATHSGEPITRTEAEAFLSAVAYYLERAGLTAPPSAAAGPLPPWPSIIRPRRDIREGRLDESVFAADLSDVVSGRGPLEYRDAAAFFHRTYLTRGLRRLLATVLSRLSGGAGDPVIQIQTPFGGGKTHSLIALYHLFRSRPGPEEAPGLEEILQEAGLSALPEARVAVFVGTAADPLRGRTPWGAIAEQLGQYERLREHDERRLAPGKDLLHSLLGEEPTLILMDEIAEYVARCVQPSEIEKAPSAPEAGRAYQTQVLAFFQELTETVKVLPRCVLVATLPSSAPYGEEGERALHQLQQIFGRVEAIYAPVEGEEIYAVIRRRLFDEPEDPEAARRVAEAYVALYRALGEDVPAPARESGYRDRMIKAYPFHPQVIDILLERWSTFPQFQRTRGVLRLLGLIAADLYRRGHAAPLIQLAHLNLAYPEIRQELLKHIGNEYEGVIASDIVDGNARAQRLDRELGSEYARFRIATGLATAIFFASFSGGERRGVGIAELRLAVLQEGVPPAIVGDALKRLEEELWYLHVEGGRYWFSSQANLNRILIEREAEVQEDEIYRELRSRLERMAGKELRAIIWPQNPEDIPDRRELQLAILPPERFRSTPSAETHIRALLERCGSVFRQYRNALLILTADAQEGPRLRGQLKRLLALQAIKSDKTVWRQLSSENQKEVDRRIQDAEGGLLRILQEAYRYVARAGKEGIEWLNLGLPTAGERASLTARVRQHLEEEGILVRQLAPDQLLRKVMRPEEGEKPLSEILEAFRRYPELPMIPDDEVIRESVRRGVREGLFGLRVGERVYYREEVPAEALAHEAVLTRRAPEPSRPPPPPIRLSPEDLLWAMGEAEDLPVSKLYQRLWAERGSAFPAEPVFREAFIAALREGWERGLFQIHPKPAGEPFPPSWEEILVGGTLHRLKLPPSPPPPPPSPPGIRRYTLRAQVPWERLSDFLRGVLMPLQRAGAELTLEIRLEARAGQPLPSSVLEGLVRETLRQIGAQVLEEREEP